MGGSQRRHGMAHGAVGEHHGSWGAGKCRSTQGRVDGEFSDQERCLRLALPSAGSAVGGRLDRHRADSRRAVAPAERGGARALGASKRHKSRERRARGHRPWPVNHSLETLTASYVSRQTAGKPKGARVLGSVRPPRTGGPGATRPLLTPTPPAQLESPGPGPGRARGLSSADQRPTPCAHGRRGGSFPCRCWWALANSGGTAWAGLRLNSFIHLFRRGGGGGGGGLGASDLGGGQLPLKSDEGQNPAPGASQAVVMAHCTVVAHDMNLWR